MPVRAQRVFLSLAFVYVLGGVMLSMTADNRGMFTYIAGALALLASFGCMSINHLRPLAIASYLIGTATVGLCGINFARIAIKWAEHNHWGEPAPLLGACLAAASLLAVALLWNAMPRTDVELADALARTLADEHLDDDSIDAALSSGSVNAAGKRAWKYGNLATASLTIAFIAVAFIAKTQFMPAGASADVNTLPVDSNPDSRMHATIRETASPDVINDNTAQAPITQPAMLEPPGVAVPSNAMNNPREAPLPVRANAPAAPGRMAHDDAAAETSKPIAVPPLDEVSPPTQRHDPAFTHHAIPDPPRSLIRSRK
jgi:hypothetical protein